MADKIIQRSKRATRRRRRVRGRVMGTSQHPRLTVAKSLTSVYAQVIDDEQGVTLAAAASNSKNVTAKLKPDMKKSEVAAIVGATIADEAKAKGIETVVFDRNKCRYHGRVKAVADAARKGGLKF